MNRLLIGTANKTRLLLQLLADLFAGGATVIDPTGELAEAAANALPPELTQRALYFDPSDFAFPIGLNVLQTVPAPSRPQLAELLYAWLDFLIPGGEDTLTKLYAKPILVAALRLLLDNRGTTLLHLMPLLSDRTYRQRLLTQCRDPVVRQTISAIDEKEYKNAVAFLLSSFRTLFMNPVVRNIVGQARSTFASATIVIANLDRVVLGDDTSRFLGGLLLTRSTGDVVINDFGFFAAKIPLPQERFTLALDFLDQLPSHLRHQVLGIEDKYVFKTGRKDAEELAFHLGLLNPRRLTDLRPDEAYSVFGGEFTPHPPQSQQRLRALRKRTRACHTRSLPKVDRELRKHS